MKRMKVWPHLTVVAILCASVAGLGVAFYLKHEQTAHAESLPNAARIQRVDGEVALNNSLNSNEADAQWIAATANQPFSVGDRIYTRDNSRTSLAFTGRNFARLDPNTSLDLIALNDRQTQLALRDGSAIFDVGYLAPGQLFEVGTPYGAVDFIQPGLYNVGISNGNAIVSVLSGLAQVVGLGGSGQISKGEMLTLVGQTAANVILSRLDGRNAGYLVDNYYAYQYPRYYDGRYLNYDVYLNDPYYFDPYRRNFSYQYVTSIIPGIYDLDYYGDWQNLSGYGYGWRPRVDSGWAPYQAGYWVNDYPYGPTWVSMEPWGYAPYHYGRWAYVGNQWFWIPEAVNTTPIYSPALVAFIPLNDSNQIGWVPLGPGDPYLPRYYNDNWQPYYLTRVDVVQPRVVNLMVPGAVTVVPIDSFGQVIDPRTITRVDPQMLAQVRPVLDPLMLTPLRNAAIHSAWGRGKIDLPPGIAKKLFNTPVITSAAPFAPPFRKDLARVLRVEPVPEKVKNQKLKFRDERQGEQVQQTGQSEVDQARKQQIDALAAQAASGNKEARRQMHELEQQQRRAQLEQQKMERQTARQAQGERVGHRAEQQPQRELMRPEVPRARQDVPRAREPQRRPQVVPQPRQMETQPPPHGRQDVPRAREPQGRPQVVNQPRRVEMHAQPQSQRADKPGKAERQQASPAAAPAGGHEGGGKGKGRKP